MNGIKKRITAVALALVLSVSPIGMGYLNGMNEAKAVALVDDATIVAVALGALTAAAITMGYKYVTSSKMQSVLDEIMQDTSKNAQTFMQLIHDGNAFRIKKQTELFTYLKNLIKQKLVTEKEADNTLVGTPTTKYYQYSSGTNPFYRNLAECRSKCLEYLKTEYPNDDFTNYDITLVFGYEQADYQIGTYYYDVYLSKNVGKYIFNGTVIHRMNTENAVYRVETNLTYNSEGELTVYCKRNGVKITNEFTSISSLYKLIKYLNVPCIWVSSDADLIKLREAGYDYDYIRTVDTDATEANETDIQIPSMASEAQGNAVTAAAIATATNGAVGSIDINEITKAIAAAISSNIPVSTAASTQATQAGSTAATAAGDIGVNASIAASYAAAANAAEAARAEASAIAAAEAAGARSFSLPEAAITAIKTKFPFCIPFDMVDGFKQLNVTTISPVFDMPLQVSDSNGGYIINHTFYIDFTDSKFKDLITLLRIGWLIIFLIGLMVATRNLIRG